MQQSVSLLALFLATAYGTSWQKFVRPADATIRPERVLQLSGDVANPSGLVDGQNPTVLNRQSADAVPPSVVVDFGQNVVGHLAIDFGRSTGNSTLPGLRLAFSETLRYLTNSSDFTRSDNAEEGDNANKLVRNGTDQIAVRPDPYTWTDSLGCDFDDKVCSDGLHGFRYVRLWLEALPDDAPHTASQGRVAIDSVRLVYSGFRGTVDSFAGWFECSDAALSQWWFDGVRTADMGTDVFRADDADPRGAATGQTLLGRVVLHDGAKRDRDPYVGDLSVAALTVYLSHADADPARNVLADVADHQRDDGWIPPASINNYNLTLFDYPLHWIVSSHDLVLHSGDLQYLHKYYSVLQKALDAFYPSVTGSDGLLSKGLAGTDGYGDYAFLPRNGSVTYYNALYVMALARAADLAGFLDKTADADRWRRRADSVSAALLEHNWDAEAGAFFDGGPCPGRSSAPICPTHPQDGNSIAILAGVTPPSRSESILAYLAGASAREYGNAFYDNDMLLPASAGADDPFSLFSTRVYAFISYFELAARFASADAATVASGFDQLRRTFGWMSRHDPGGTFWEGIGPDGLPYEEGYTSMAHGWSTGVTPLLTRFVLSVQPVAPGFSRFRVRPVVGGGLRWAQGVVPTPVGGIAVRWDKTGGRFELSVAAPAGTEAEVEVPAGERARILVDGEAYGQKAKHGAAYRDGHVVFSVKGNHTFVVEVED